MQASLCLVEEPKWSQVVASEINFGHVSRFQKSTNLRTTRWEPATTPNEVIKGGRQARRMDVPPKSRYTDTSYLIFQQLKEGGLQCAFPAIWDLLHPGVSGKVALPDELPAGVEPLAEQPSKNGKKPAGQYKAKDSRKSAASGIPRKQSKIAEKRKNRRSLELKAVEEAPREEEDDAVSVREEVGGAPAVPDEKKLQICDMSGVTGGGDPRHVSVISSGDDEVQKDIQVSVDFHHRPDSEVEPASRSTTETNNNDVRCKSHNEPVPTPTPDSDVESVRTVTPGPVPPREVDRGKAPGVQIRRKQYDLYELPYLTGSEYSESDFTDTASSVGGELELDALSAASSSTVGYATVEVRQKNQEDEQQQIINKYNSLPLHALQNQQHQYQSPHLQQSRPASSLSHVNNNNGNHYHNYSSAHHHNNINNNHNGLHQSPSWSNGNATGPDGPLRLSYVTERILASILPARRHRYRNGSTTPQSQTPGSPGFVDEHERELIEMLEQKHERNYRIFDLESCIASISLEKLCELCKHIDSWLGSGKEKIVVLQDRSDKQRLGAAIAAYLEYQKICGSNFPQSNRTKALPSPGGGLDGRRTPTWLDLDLYSTQRFLESVTGPLRVPSHKRYIRYFSGLLAGTIKMNASSVFLRAIIVESPPCLHYRAVTVNSEWRSFIKVFEGVRCLFTSDIYVIPITTRQFIYEIKHPLRLRGDVLVRCYQIIPNNNKLHDEKELISAVQFHTCAITEKEVQFAKLELDLACDDERFPADHKLTLCIDTVPNEKSAILVFQNPLVRIEPIIENGDNLETINGGDESSHTQGPLDGSLYATILKSPKSPTTTSGSAASQQTLISPPAEFSNGKPLPLNGASGSGPPVTPPPRSSTPGAYLYESAKRYHQSASNGTVTAALHRGNASTHSNDSNNNNNNTSGNYRDVIENGSASASGGYDQNQNPLVGSGSSAGGRDSGRSAGVHQVRSQADGRESSVRSPLTLSMDSGISSSGAVNRRLQGSSVSPSSFPSQASPQDDRHRELDDLLSDMLMTVQGIPDAVGRNKNHHQSQQHHQADHFVNTSTDTIKRSHSAQLPALREEPTASSAAAKERELLMYETSSTTTTLTPPPSESGRDTPLLSSTSNYSTIRDKRELTGAGPLTPTERELIMNLQHQQQHQLVNHQSFGYPRQARSTTGASERFTSDDDDDNFARPYHAREDSRPFTYGSIPLTGTPQNPPASTMIKMQSGLSSPSMVRKALGTPTSARKSTSSGGVTFGNGIGGPGGRNSDFEEMLRERREKVLSEKYTIGDQQSSPGGGGGGLNGTDTVDNAGTRYYQKTIKTVTTEHGVNGYPAAPPHEPLKRSNTMDGSFGRQFSNDGISGQTWLQLQQQKLRARKEQQKREHSNSFSYSYGSPAFPTAAAAAGETPLYHSGTTHRRSQTLSPVRNERNYHTLTTTTRTHSTERPFVAVKRAYENAKMQTIGAREESFSSYRSETEPDNSPTGGSPRPETPAFPVTPRTPYGLSNGTSSPALPPKSPTSQRKDLFTGQRSQDQHIQNQNETMSCYTSRRNSTTSNANSEPQEVAPQFVKFARDSSKYWYKPAISREEAIGLLRNAPPGTFVVRDSTTFANAYGLVVKVAHPPPGVQPKAGSNGDELVRHFLVEPTIRGVRLKGCSNEPVFTSLSALVYQHSITPLALPCRLIIPDSDLQQTDFQSPAQQQLLTQGAACNVLYLFTCDTESLTGPQAIRKAVGLLLSLRPLPKPTQVHFKVSIQGITLTDNTRQLFFRRHYPSNNVSFCGLDPDEHRWSIPSTTGDIPASKRIFAFVGKRSPTSADNQCHVFCELEATQPATAIVSFANKVVLGGTGGGSASHQPQQPVARAI